MQAQYTRQPFSHWLDEEKHKPVLFLSPINRCGAELRLAAWSPESQSTSFCTNGLDAIHNKSPSSHNHATIWFYQPLRTSTWGAQASECQHSTPRRTNQAGTCCRWSRGGPHQGNGHDHGGYRQELNITSTCASPAHPSAIPTRDT